MKPAVVLLWGSLFAVGTPAIASAATYMEDFNTDAGGWEALKNAGVDVGVYRSTGGVGGSGYLEGFRPDGFAPSFFPGNARAAENALGNLESRYGSLIEISYAGRIFSMGMAQPVLHLFGTTGGGNWRREVASAADTALFLADWTGASLIIDTNWSNAEAVAEGWVPSAGASDWAIVLENVTIHHPFYGFSGGNATAGLDDFRMSSVPLPGAAWLLAPAFAALARTHRCAHRGFRALSSTPGR